MGLSLNKATASRTEVNTPTKKSHVMPLIEGDRFAST